MSSNPPAFGRETETRTDNHCQAVLSSTVVSLGYTSRCFMNRLIGIESHSGQTAQGLMSRSFVRVPPASCPALSPGNMFTSRCSQPFPQRLSLCLECNVETQNQDPPFACRALKNKMVIIVDTVRHRLRRGGFLHVPFDPSHMGIGVSSRSFRLANALLSLFSPVFLWSVKRIISGHHVVKAVSPRVIAPSPQRCGADSVRQLVSFRQVPGPAPIRREQSQ